MTTNKKVILITGASSGMGKITALDLIKKGHIVYGAARGVDKMKELEQAGGHILEMDVTNEEQMKAGVEQIIKEQGRIDVLWNNAGYGLYGPMEEIPMDKARFQFEVNLFGLATLTQMVLPHMRKAQSGTIINTSSMGGKIYFPLGAWYHASKHALEGWSDSMRLDLKAFGIDVVILEPGLIETGFGEEVQNQFPESSKKGPYAKLVNAMLGGLEKGDLKGSDPKVISQTIEKIINSKKPKTRYVVGKMAKPMMFIRKWFGDRVFDKVMMSQFK